MADPHESPAGANQDPARRRRRRSVALALMLAALVALFYVMALVHGPALVSRPT